MILGFKTYFPDGTETNFVNKILANVDPGLLTNYRPKLHTLRQDKNKRWHHGRDIQMVTNHRQSNQKQFNLGIPELSRCWGVQEVIIIWADGIRQIYVDERQLGIVEVAILAKNDGFESPTDFLNFFVPTETSPAWYGRIIHWTKLKY